MGVGVFLPPLPRRDRKVSPPDGWNEEAGEGRRGPGRRSQKVYAKSLPSPGRPLGVGVFLPPLPRGDRKVPPPDGWNEEAGGGCRGPGRRSGKVYTNNFSTTRPATGSGGFPTPTASKGQESPPPDVWNEEARGGRRGRGGDRRRSTPRAFHHSASHWEWGFSYPHCLGGTGKSPPDGWNEEAREGRRGRGRRSQKVYTKSFSITRPATGSGGFPTPTASKGQESPPPDVWNEEARGGRRGRGGDRRRSTPRAFHHSAGHWEWGFSYPHCLGGTGKSPLQMGGTKRREKVVAVRGGDRGRSTPTTFPPPGRPLGVGVFLPPLPRGDRKVPPPDGWNEEAGGGCRGPGRRSGKVYTNNFSTTRPATGSGGFPTPTASGGQESPPPDGWNEEARGGRRGRGGDRRRSTPRAFHHPAGHWEWGFSYPHCLGGDRKVSPPDGWNEEAGEGRRGPGRRSQKVYTKSFSITRPATSVSRNSRPM